MDDNQEQLLWQLRGLRRDQEPAGDLWPGIAARIAQVERPVRVVSPRPRRAARFVPWAMAASLVLALGVAWQQRPQPASGAAALVTPGPSARLIHREAEAMTREYTAALRELHASGAGTGDEERSDALHQLDLSASQIRSALAHDPDARFLLDRLRSTYDKRLRLTQHAMLG